MINGKLIYYAIALILNRYTYWKNVAQKDEATVARASAYKAAFDILWYAINNNEECLKEFDCYDD